MGRMKGEKKLARNKRERERERERERLHRLML